MRQQTKTILAVFLGVLAFSVNVSAQRNAITGTVTNTSHQPIANLWIELLNDVDSILKRTRTDTTGRYSFQGLSYGTFHVRVVTLGTGYRAQTARIELIPATIRGTGSHNEQIDFSLKTENETKKPVATSGSRTTFVQEVPEAARKAYEQGIHMLETGKNTNDAIAKLQEAIQLFPTYYLALERLGLEQVKQGKYDQAREVLSKALEVNSGGTSCYYAMGVIHYQSKKWTEAIEALRRALALAPDSPNAAFEHFYLGLALIKTGKSADAEPHLKKSYELGGNNIPSDVHMHLAQYYSNNKQYKEAADELELFLKKTPDARDAENIRNIIKQLRAKASKTS
ncbi:MAG: tetratricopeptide repeat protein [Acidobacteria bacterium]|nr:tetratricopeptide repeat protein [Acidobacteriota bacterium]MBS1811038.1 tetratricopeptide repeat protein [Acidobacteriota bacterium]